MLDQTILACDDNGNFEEYIPRMIGHTGMGRRHIGLTILLTNNKGQFLLQRRKHQIFDNVWCFSADTHRLHTKAEDESLEQATERCLKVEYNIIEKFPINNLGFFNYFGKDDGYCENEYCAMVVGEYNGSINMNPKVGYEYRWVNKKEFLTDLEKNPEKYAPWVIEGVKILKKVFFR